MHGVCSRYVTETSETKDIVQESFLKVFSKIKQYSAKGSLEGWIKRIVINTAITHYRKNIKHYRHFDINYIHETNIENTISYPVENKKIDIEIDKKDIDKENINVEMIYNADFSKQELIEVLNVLPSSFKIVFNLYAIEHYKHKEIAKMLNIGINTSRTRLMRARNIIQKNLYKMSIEKMCR